MRRMITRCPNCGVTLRRFKTPVVLFTPSAALGRISPLLAPLKVGIVVQPYSCLVCGLVQLFAANRSNASFASAGRIPSAARKRRARAVRRRAA